MQTLEAHCRGTARYAGESLAWIGLEQAGHLAGLLHDMGKTKDEFMDYLLSGQGSRGSVNHTFAGCRLLLEQFHGETAQRPEDMTSELLAIAVGGHHGLFDCVDANGRSGFLHRMEKSNIGYEESRRNFLRYVGLDEIEAGFQAAHGELMPIYERLGVLADGNDEECAFYYGLLARLLLSAVIEGDRRDTAEFMSGIRYPEAPRDMSLFWGKSLSNVEEKLDRFPKDTAIQRARAAISDQCRRFAERPGGVYRLNVPTGAGKTLSALRYALAHAKRWGKRRLIFTSPLLAILEQNAAVIREFLGDDGMILEHHSNVLAAREGEELDQRELAVESWNAPVIITTLVQLLNTLFDGRTTAIRRFQNLCGSVIVIDEVQTVPNRMLTLFDLAVNFLSEVCGATVLLCSATQPCLERADHPLRVCLGDVVPYDDKLWEPFRRTRITDVGAMDLEEIARFAREVLEDSESLLIVCNKKSEAEQLYRSLEGAAEVCRHLSASMCIAHRRRTLEELGEALEQGRKCLCVSTQVIEAGVDISFERVIRLTAGMDSVIQSAGRCNRHGERETPVPVYVVQCANENLGRLREIQAGQIATMSLLDACRRDPQRFGNDLSSDAAVEYYYRKLYGNMPIGFQDHHLDSKGVSLFGLLSHNLKYWDDESPFYGKYMMNQAFRMAGGAFQVFDNDTRDVVVPFGGGAELIAELAGREVRDPAFLMDWLRRARPYTVAVYDYQLRVLAGAVTDYDGIAVLSPEHYDERTGLVLRPGDLDYLEV